MSIPDLFTAAERRLALLLFLLAALGAMVRLGREVSPEVAVWLEDPEGSTPAAADSGGGRVAASPPSPVAEARPEPPGLAPGRLDPNHATREELIALPGIGPALAGRILADREENGPYRRARDLLRVSGIGPATLRRITPYLAIP